MVISDDVIDALSQMIVDGHTIESACSSLSLILITSNLNYLLYLRLQTLVCLSPRGWITD